MFLKVAVALVAALLALNAPAIGGGADDGPGYPPPATDAAPNIVAPDQNTLPLGSSSVCLRVEFAPMTNGGIFGYCSEYGPAPFATPQEGYPAP